MYDDTKLDRPVTRKDLDEAVPDHPAMVGHRGGHTGVYNSKAFELAGISAATPDPEGGKFYRENGELTGKVAERARGVFNRVGRREPVTRETRQKGVEFISKQMTAAGITSVHQTGGGADDMAALRDAYAAGTLRFRMYFFPRGGYFDALRSDGVRTGAGDDWLKIGAVKYGADGSASERTMRMSTPHVGRPDDFGILTMSAEEIQAAVETAHRAGFQIGIHANGDVAIGYVLDAYERVQRQFPRPDARHRIEHCSLVNPALLRRIKAAGVIPTPFYTYVYFHGDKWAEYGPEKMRWMFAHRSFLDHEIPVPGASDYMPGPYEPMMALQSLVTRTDYAGREWGLNQRVSIQEAIHICTSNGAWASFEEHSKGTITPGKLADFVLLAEDPLAVEPSRLKDIAIVSTFVGGRLMYEA
jgi:predicted amidohydrolase YtcJ